MKSVTAAQMRHLDRRTIESGTAGKLLMERAGRGVVDAMLERWREYRGGVVVLAGKGNNGGDGFVVARHLAQRTSATVTVLLACKKGDLKGDALHHFRKMPKSVKVASAEPKLLRSASVIVDGLLGTGIEGEVRSPYRELIEQINEARDARVVAIDIPSGLNADTGEPCGVAVRADLTVTMGLPKIGLLRPAATDWVGELEVVDIGIPAEFIRAAKSDVELIAAADLARLFPRRERSAHKGCYGHVLVLAGAEGYHGAAVLCAEAAARAGAGLTTLGVPRRIYSVVASQCREVMVRPFDDTEEGSFSIKAVDGLGPWFRRCNAVALGPGLTQNQVTCEFVARVVEACPSPIVIDADGLNCLAGQTGLLRKRNAPTIVTPHPGEMARLIKKTTQDVQSDRWGVARAFAEEFGAIIVLKGAGTVVAGRSNSVLGPQSSVLPIWINMTGGPALAKGGSGDILTGVIASLVAQRLDPFEAAKAGVFLHGRAADLAAQELGDRCVLARDVLAKLGEAIRRASR